MREKMLARTRLFSAMVLTSGQRPFGISGRVKF